MTCSDRSDLTIAIEQLKATASNLPGCDRAAKLRGLILRLEWAVADGSDVTGTVTGLADATKLALDHDPWVQLDRIAQRLSREVSATDPDGLGGNGAPDEVPSNAGRCAASPKEQRR